MIFPGGTVWFYVKSFVFQALGRQVISMRELLTKEEDMCILYTHKKYTLKEA